MHFLLFPPCNAHVFHDVFRLRQHRNLIFSGSNHPLIHTSFASADELLSSAGFSSSGTVSLLSTAEAVGVMSAGDPVSLISPRLRQHIPYPSPLNEGLTSAGPAHRSFYSHRQVS